MNPKHPRMYQFPTNQAGNYTCLALVPRPLEQTCLDELLELGAQSPKILPGAVSFQADLETVYLTNLASSTAMRILLVLSDFPCETSDDLYAQARDISWEDWIPKDTTFSIRMQGQTPHLRHSVYAAQRLKDALVDRFRDQVGTRPSVDKENPTFQIHAQLYEQQGIFRCAVSIDSSGTPLYQRGYRTFTTTAPLKENLAATLLRLCDLHNQPDDLPVVDPFCGAGTFLIEAALMKKRRAPGLHRTFAFQNWPHFDFSLFQKVKQHLMDGEKKDPIKPSCFGFDKDPRMIRQSIQHASFAGVDKIVSFSTSDIQQTKPPQNQKGIVICNPPYGQRLSDEESLIPVYRDLGNTLKRHFSGWTAYVLTASLPLGRQIGLQPQKRWIVYNGPLEGRLLKFELY